MCQALTTLHPYNCLSIESSELRHSGVYRLYARNTAGAAMSEFRLRVRPSEEHRQEMVNEMTMRKAQLR